LFGRHKFLRTQICFLRDINPTVAEFLTHPPFQKSGNPIYEQHTCRYTDTYENRIKKLSMYSVCTVQYSVNHSQLALTANCSNTNQSHRKARGTETWLLLW